jgi:hypothetical protein
MPTITTFERRDLIVETAFTGIPRSQMDSNRNIKKQFSPVDVRDVLAGLLRLL